MPTYTFAPQLNDQPPDPKDEFTHELPCDAVAIENGRIWFDTIGQGWVSASLAVGRGRGSEIEWLGAFDWSPGRAPKWAPAE